MMLVLCRAYASRIFSKKMRVLINIIRVAKSAIWKIAVGAKQNPRGGYVTGESWPRRLRIRLGPCARENYSGAAALKRSSDDRSVGRNCGHCDWPILYLAADVRS